MANSYTVCWNPSSTTPVTFIDTATGGSYSGTSSVNQPTQFTYSAGGTQVGTNPCSDSKVVPFTIKVAPNASDVTVQTNNGPVVTFTDLYKNKGETIQMNMSLTSGGNGYAVDGGKPVIRNEPSSQPPPTGGTPPHSYLIGAIVLLVIVAIAYWLWRKRPA
jgi:hypothetical protein